jgi:hypothetical protein
MPRGTDFFAAPRPISRILNARPIGKHKGRPELAEVGAILVRRRKEFGELCRRLSTMGLGRVRRCATLALSRFPNLPFRLGGMGAGRSYERKQDCSFHRFQSLRQAQPQAR